MSSWQVSTVLAGVAVGEVDPAVDWYRVLLGGEPDARSVPAPPGRSLPGNYTLQVVHGPERPGSVVTGNSIILVEPVAGADPHTRADRAV